MHCIDFAFKLLPSGPCAESVVDMHGRLRYAIAAKVSYDTIMHTLRACYVH